MFSVVRSQKSIFGVGGSGSIVKSSHASGAAWNGGGGSSQRPRRRAGAGAASCRYRASGKRATSPTGARRGDRKPSSGRARLRAGPAGEHGRCSTSTRRAAGAGSGRVEAMRAGGHRVETSGGGAHGRRAPRWPWPGRMWKWGGGVRRWGRLGRRTRAQIREGEDMGARVVRGSGAAGRPAVAAPEGSGAAKRRAGAPHPGGWGSRGVARWTWGSGSRRRRVR